MDNMNTNSLQSKIEQEYKDGNYGNGWGLLYSSVATLKSSKFVFLGINPGGSIPSDVGTFSCEERSAYNEQWELSKKFCPAGKSPLQMQVKYLFQNLLETKIDDVLCGNLVPFRSSSWNNLKNKNRALKFGKEIWQPILNSRFLHVFTMGRVCEDAVVHLTQAQKTKEINTGWGRSKARIYKYENGIICALPHLSRFKIFGRGGKSQKMESEIKKMFMK